MPILEGTLAVLLSHVLFLFIKVVGNHSKYEPRNDYVALYVWNTELGTVVSAKEMEVSWCLVVFPVKIK
jgi:hypothetical protein